MCYSLDPENPTKSSKAEVQILVFPLRTFMKPPMSLRVSEKSPSIWKMSLSRAMCAILLLQCWSWSGDYRPNNRVGHRVTGTKRVLNFYSTYAKSNTELKGFIYRFSEHWAIPGEQNPQDVVQDLQSSWSDQPICEPSLPHGDDPYWKRTWPQNQRGGCTEEKDIPEETEEKKLTVRE